MTTDALQIAILGAGTVGSGVINILTEHSDRISRVVGRPIRIKHIVVRDVTKQRDFSGEVDSSIITDDTERALNDPDVSVVVQLIGGTDAAFEKMQRALVAGKDVVTANKALLAEHGRALFDQARSLGRSIAFEASVAGGVPIIAGIAESLAANQITSIRGILNGTCNFIVSQMEQAGASYDYALAEAQQLGFAEADPTMDVDGTDAAQKLAILSQLAFGAALDWKKIPRIGIDALESSDMAYASELAYRIKLLAVAELDEAGDLVAHVSPTLVRRSTPLAEVQGANNAICAVGDAVGQVFFHGLGAGQMPTASAVVADLISMAQGRAQLTFKALNLWSGEERAALGDVKHAPGRFYIRLRVDDASGVLAEVSGILSSHDISIASVIQHEHDETNLDNVDLVIMTHNTCEGAIEEALLQLFELPAVKVAPVKMRVLD